MEIEEVVEILQGAVSPSGKVEVCSLSSAYDRILAEDLYAPLDVPPFPKSAMDGYAVRSSDVSSATKDKPVTLSVLGEVFAGDGINNFSLKENPALRVMTGSPLPPGCDAVVMQENTDYGEREVKVFSPVKKMQNYCPQGEDIKKDSLVLKKGCRLSRTQIGLLSSLGFDKVKVFKTLSVSLLCTGSELQLPGEKLEEGKIYSSIGEMLSYSIKQEGFSLSRLKVLADEEKIISEEIEKSLEDSDLIITSGGVSVGKKDLLPHVLEKLGAEKLFSHVNVQPGTPTLASLLKGKVILSLSGNPFAALANFDLYFYPLVSVLMQSESFLLPVEKALLQTPYEKINLHRRLVRAYASAGKVYLPSEKHAASVLSSMSECNCYLDVPSQTKYASGELVTVRFMRSLH